MNLKWENYGAVASALEEKYPDEDLVNLNNKRLLELVNTLDRFEDEFAPEDDSLLKAIHYAWINYYESQ